MAIGNTHKNFEDRTCSSEDMIADRQTHRQTDTLIAILCCRIVDGVISRSMADISMREAAVLSQCVRWTDGY